ncbi:MAG: endonuclease [Chloroflexota bacterium]|jgi:endonuclease-8|nr:endonuclease [Chloroflexota bacterium]
MPEGDTLHRTATVLRDVLAGRPVLAARGRPDGAALGRTVGSRVERVESQGKHLLIGFDNGLTLHTHLRMHGSWHRYRSGERWQRSPSRAVAVIEVPGAVAVCFDAPTVELLDTRALALHPGLAALGPDLVAPEPDLAAAVARLSTPERASMTVGEALLDQRALAGLGNVYRSELLFIERVDPFLPMERVSAEVVERLVATGARLLKANINDPSRITVPDALGAQPGAMGTVGPRGPRSRLWVYGRAGRPCRRCGTPIRSMMLGSELPRRVYWCPICQAAGAGARSEAGD